MKKCFLPITVALAVLCFGCAAYAADDPVAALMQGKAGEAWDKVKEAHAADLAAGNMDAIKELAGKEDYAPEAVLAILAMARDGDTAAADYIFSEAKSEETLAGALCEISCVFLDYDKAIPALISRLEKTGGDADYYRGVAGFALAHITGAYIEPDMKKWQAWWDANKDKFKPDNIIDCDLLRYEIRNGLLTSSLVFNAVGQDDHFMELAAEYYKSREKAGAPAQRWPLADALAAMGKGEFDKARTIADAALKTYPDDIYAMYISACMALQAGDVKAAQAGFEALAALNSQMRGAKFLAAYCKELLAAGGKPGDVETLLKLYRALPAQETARGWYVPDMYVFTKAFDRTQADILNFATGNLDKPDLLAGALLMMDDTAVRLQLVNEGLKQNPNDALLGVLRLQFLTQSGIKKNKADVAAEIEALAKLDPDDALPDCLRIFVNLKNPWSGEYLDSRAAPLADDELKTFLDAAGKKRFATLTGRKTRALEAACKEMGGPAWHTRAMNILTESLVAEPQWVLSSLTIMAASNISDAVAAGDMAKAEEIYKAIESLASKVAAGDNSLSNASLAQLMMKNADTGMADGYSRAGKQKEAQDCLRKITQRQAASGIGPVQVDPYRWLRCLPVPAVSEAVSGAMLNDEKGFYKDYPDPSLTNEGE